MVRLVPIIFILIIIIFSNSTTVFCLPLNFSTKCDKLNNSIYFYYGNVDKILLESDLNIFINNFDQISFDLVKYLKTDNVNNIHFKNKNPQSHPNLILGLKYQYLEYYYSFPFSHNNILYYEFLNEFDLYGSNDDQYWRPYIGVHDKNFVKVNKLNLNPENYIFKNSLKGRIYDILKTYVHK